MGLRILVKDSLKVVKNNPLTVLLLVLLDVAFLFLFGFLHPFFTNNIIDLGVEITGAFARALNDAAVVSLTGILFSPTVKPFFMDLLWWMLGLGLVLYVLFCVFQGSSWFLAKQLLKKSSFLSYMKRFFKVNVLWFFLLGVYFLLNLLFDMRRRVLSVTEGEPVTSYALYVLYALLFVLAYFMLVSFSTGVVRTAWSLGTKKWKVLVPVVLLVALVIAVVQGLLLLVGVLHPTLAIIGGVFLLFLFQWGKILMLKSVEGLHGLC